MAMEYKTVGTLEAEGLFQIGVKVDQAVEYMNVLGIVLRRLEESPISKEQLEWIGQASVEYAKELLIESNAYQKGDLYRSVQYRVPQDNRLEIFADARDSRTKYPYGASVEYGFHPWGKSQYVSPRPFLRPAIKYAQMTTKYSVAEATRLMLLGELQNIVRTGFFSGHTENLSIGSKIYRAGPTHGMKGIKGTYMTRTKTTKVVSRRTMNKDTGRITNRLYRNGNLRRKTTAGRHVKVPQGRTRQVGIKQSHKRFSATPRSTSNFRKGEYLATYDINLSKKSKG